MEKLAVEAEDRGTLADGHRTTPGPDAPPARHPGSFRRLGSPSLPEFALQNGGSAQGAGEMPLPKSAAEPIADMLMYMGLGKAVVVVPIPKQVSSLQAADILNVSHPYMLNLINEGKVPHYTVDGESTVLLTELLDFKTRDDGRARDLINELTRETQAMGLYEI